MYRNGDERSGRRGNEASRDRGGRGRSGPYGTDRAVRNHRSSPSARRAVVLSVDRRTTKEWAMWARFGSKLQGE
ncbi:unnamed protein product [Spirodela intermedia]|uniref:Uncharacterized protein n=1 Tax=Spirodela intermedia TaxID=51605 RepID=A0A7I8IZJ9_SPIIN|nr:unnamed protein product [Spirodela intermedia]CAA6663308.1 unnamed protein product [Spirodela intermedia]